MQNTMHIYKPNGCYQKRILLMPNRPTFEYLSKLLNPIILNDDGGHFEHVCVLKGSKYRDMFVDEEGHLKNLPRNERATGIYRANAMSYDPRIDPETLPFIAGTAVLFDKQVWF